ncbi:MAG: formylglycine-generating enzyme family protein [Cyclobacteriaceae bacterium]|nr:formylglycine-generating enzyme family protein [Cyclobacteriaceae bacterium]
MKCVTGFFCWSAFMVMTFINVNAQSVGMVEIKGGAFVPLYGNDSVKVKVDDFFIDVFPITREEYLQFVKDNPYWQRSNAKKIFADGNYLINWYNDLHLNEDTPPQAPITNVSWFAAKRYCEIQGKRLPTMDEWEFVAMANEKLPDARTDSLYNQYILNWYETPKTFNQQIGSTFKNYWGVYDLHGLVWEWTLDFNSVLLSGESRKDVDNDRNLFCGSGSIGATDLMNYAAFMRYAFRGSIKANYSVKNLGFRCAKDK